MGDIRRSAVWLAAFFAATMALACHDHALSVRTMATALPSRAAIHTELHRRQLVARLSEVAERVREAEVPTLCRRPTGDLAKARALVVTRQMLRALDKPGVEIPTHQRQLNAGAFETLADAAGGFAEGDRAALSAAIRRVPDHRYLAVVDVRAHRAPSRLNDRAVSPGRLRGEVVLVDAERLEPLCRGEVEAVTSSSMNAYGKLDEEAFAADLAVNFLRAVEDQLTRATGGMKLAGVEEVSPRLASHGSSAPFANPP